MKTYPDLKNEVMLRHYTYRNLYNLVITERFQDAYQRANGPNKHLVEGWLIAGDLINIKKWLKDNLKSETLAYLKEQAKNKNISGWSRMDKYALICALEAYEDSRVVQSSETAAIESGIESPGTCLQTE